MKLKEVLEIFRNKEYKEKIECLMAGLIDEDEEEYSKIDSLFETKETYTKSKKANLLLIIWNFFVYPMVFLHELSHLIIAIISFQKPRKFYISSPFYTNLNGCICMSKTKINMGAYLTNLAPLLILFLAVLLPYINSYFLIFTAYTILTLKWSIPSKQDIYNIILYKYSKEFPDMIYLIINRVYQNVSFSDLLQAEGVNYAPNFVKEFLGNDYTVFYKKLSNY